MFCDLLYFSSQLSLQRPKNHRKKTLLQKKSNFMLWTVAQGFEKVLCEVKKSVPTLQTLGHGHLCEAVLQRACPEAGVQVSHFSVVLAGRRKSSPAELHKDKRKGWNEMKLKATDSNNAPFLHRYSKLRRPQVHKCHHSSSSLLLLLCGFFFFVYLFFLNACKLPVVATYCLKSFHGWVTWKAKKLPRIVLSPCVTAFFTEF